MQIVGFLMQRLKYHFFNENLNFHISRKICILHGSFFVPVVDSVRTGMAGRGTAFHLRDQWCLSDPRRVWLSHSKQ